MLTPTQEAFEAMKSLRAASEAYLSGFCDECQPERTETPRGLVISKVSGVLAVEARFVPRDPLVSGDLSFKVAWNSGATKLPLVEMNVHSGDEIKPCKLTVRNFPGISSLLEELIERPRPTLRLMK